MSLNPWSLSAMGWCFGKVVECLGRQWNLAGGSSSLGQTLRFCCLVLLPVLSLLLDCRCKAAAGFSLPLLRVLYLHNWIPQELWTKINPFPLASFSQDILPWQQKSRQSRQHLWKQNEIVTIELGEVHASFI